MKCSMLKPRQLRPALAAFLALLGGVHCGARLDSSGLVGSDSGEQGSSHIMPAGTGAYSFLGAGYDVTKEFANANSARIQVVDVDKFANDHTAKLIETSPQTQEAVELYGENAEAYSKKVTTKVNASAELKLFGLSLSNSFSSSFSTTEGFDAKYIYASYSVVVKQKRYRFKAEPDLLKNYLNPEFVADLKNLSPKEIVKNYGTHILMDISTGARLDMMFQSETKNTNRAYASSIMVKTGMKDVFGVDVSNEVDITAKSENFNKKLVYKTRGGDPSRALVGQLDLEKTTSKISVADWQGSSNTSNADLIDIGEEGLIPLYDVIEEPTKKTEMKAYIDQYLKDNQVQIKYLPVEINVFFNSRTGKHFYSQTNVSPNGYHYEYTPWHAYAYQAPGTVPIYVYCHCSGDCYYWPSKFSPPDACFKPEGIAFYAYATETPGTIPVHRYFNRKSGDHYLWSSYDGSIQSIPGYAYENIAFYVLPTPKN